jgi:hypothetical protein
LQGVSSDLDELSKLLPNCNGGATQEQLGEFLSWLEQAELELDDLARIEVFSPSMNSKVGLGSSTPIAVAGEEDRCFFSAGRVPGARCGSLPATGAVRRVQRS